MHVVQISTNKVQLGMHCMVLHYMMSCKTVTLLYTHSKRNIYYKMLKYCRRYHMYMYTLHCMHACRHAVPGSAFLNALNRSLSIPSVCLLIVLMSLHSSDSGFFLPMNCPTQIMYSKQQQSNFSILFKLQQHIPTCWACCCKLHLSRLQNAFSNDTLRCAYIMIVPPYNHYCYRRCQSKAAHVEAHTFLSSNILSTPLRECRSQANT
jgi:hypothetical protein